MSERKMKWFRSWHGAPTDLKWVMVARRAKVPVGAVVSVVWALYDYASQHEGDDRGLVDGFPVDQISAFFGYEEDDVNRILVALADAGVIEGDRVANWNKYQPKRDREDNTAAERQRRRRAKCRDVGVTERDIDTDNCHATSHHVTPPDGRDSRDKPNVTPLRYKILDLEEDIIKPSSKKLDRSPPGEHDAPTVFELKADFDEWYEIYPRHAGVGAARAKYLAARKNGISKETLLEGARAAAKYYSKQVKNYIPMPATWLNQERWADDYTGPPPTQETRGSKPEVDYFEGAI